MSFKKTQQKVPSRVASGLPQNTYRIKGCGGETYRIIAGSEKEAREKALRGEFADPFDALVAFVQQR